MKWCGGCQVTLEQEFLICPECGDLVVEATPTLPGLNPVPEDDTIVEPLVVVDVLPRG